MIISSFYLVFFLLFQNRYGYSFGIYLPESLITISNGICVSGCPPDQVLKIETVDNSAVLSRIPAATLLCKQRFADVSPDDVTLEARIKACIFDVAVTGDNTLAFDHIQEMRDEIITSDESQQSKKSMKIPKSSDISRSITKQETINQNDNNKLCLPIDLCASTSFKINALPRVAYPGKSNYFFECSADGIIHTRRCPISTIFDGKTCTFIP